MKLLYELEYIEVENEIVVVPIGGKQFNGVIKVSKDAMDVLNIIKDANDANEVLERVFIKFPNDNKKELTEQVCGFLNLLLNEGILECPYEKDKY